MTRLLHRLGGAAAAHPWRVLATWLVVAATVVGLGYTIGGTPQDDWNVPGTPSQAGTELLRAEFPDAAGAVDRVVVHDPDGAVPDAEVTALAGRLGELEHVIWVSEPRVSDDGATVLMDVRYDVPVTDDDIFGDLTPLREAAGPAEDAGLQVAFGGEVPDSASMKPGGTGEAVGVLVALVLLVLTFASVVAAGLPILVALLGLGVGSSGVLLLAAVMDVSTSAPTVATMVSLGVGIDYALLLVTRHVEGLHAGLSVRAAAARATATAGRAVVFAGATVLVSLLGLGLAGLQTYATFGLATAIGVVSVMAAALTLVPAALGLAGRRVLPRGDRHARRGAGVSTRAPLAARWAGRVGRRPLPWALAALLLLITLALPVLDLRMWPADVGAQPQDSTARQANDLIADAFGPGANGPFLVAVDLDEVPSTDLAALASRLEETPGVAGVAPPELAANGEAAVLVLEPTTAPADERTTDLLDRLRADVLPEGVEITGQTPVFADITEILDARIWVVIGFVVAVSVLLLTLVFRAPVVAVKAAVMNLLSIGAAYGVMVAVFSWGWGRQLFGLDQDVPISSWVPILMFAVAFGLSMDYEVFLLSRIREEWRRTGDSRASVVAGLAVTGRLITAAAAIMVAVFLGFATEGDLVLKQVGAGLAVAVLIDATVVRMVLVPATMALLGHWNWWLPGWLDRLLPHLDIEPPAPPVVPSPRRPMDDESRTGDDAVAVE